MEISLDDNDRPLGVGNELLLGTKDQVCPLPVLAMSSTLTVKDHLQDGPSLLPLNASSLSPFEALVPNTPNDFKSCKNS